MSEDYKERIRERILNRDTFVRAVFTGQQKSADIEWVKIFIRPVEIKGSYRWQFSFFDEKKDVSKNYDEKETPIKLSDVLTLPFRNILVENTSGTLQVNVSKKGKAIVSEHKTKDDVSAPDLSHNRSKTRSLTAENAKPFLEAVGILTRDGRIKADMQRKYVQINEFLRLFDEMGDLESFQGKPLHIVDFGCGNAYLTFAVYYYLHDVLELDVHVTGVDLKADLIERHREKAQKLGWGQLNFEVGHIQDFQPGVPPDIVVALHACDTATDDAIAKGLGWGSRIIICAPCCQHDLQVQMAQASLPESMAAVLGHGILFERMGDILTDTFRAATLRIMGYRTDVTQFVPIEHTAKNLMIRAVKISAPGKNPRWVEEYRKLKDQWNVTPYLEKILGDDFSKHFI